jgi:hypothetical protein
MSNNIWSHDRVARVGSIMERYTPLVEVGTPLRLGLEDEPCYPYRGAGQAPTGKVVSLRRGEDNFLSMEVAMDGTGELLTIDNRSLDPKRVWEIGYRSSDGDGENRSTTSSRHDPSPGEAEAAGRVLMDEAGRGPVDGDGENRSTTSSRHDPSPGEAEAAGRVLLDEMVSEVEEPTGGWPVDEAFRGLETRMDDVYGRIEAIEGGESDFRSTTASTLRYLAADLVRLSRGEALEFASRYADRYDMATDSPYKGTTSRGTRGRGASSKDTTLTRHDWHVSPLSYDTAPVTP